MILNFWIILRRMTSWPCWFCNLWISFLLLRSLSIDYSFSHTFNIHIYCIYVLNIFSTFISRVSLWIPNPNFYIYESDYVFYVYVLSIKFTIQWCPVYPRGYVLRSMLMAENMGTYVCYIEIEIPCMLTDNAD